MDRRQSWRQGARGLPAPVGLISNTPSAAIPGRIYVVSPAVTIISNGVAYPPILVDNGAGWSAPVTSIFRNTTAVTVTGTTTKTISQFWLKPNVLAGPHRLDLLIMGRNYASSYAASGAYARVRVKFNTVTVVNHLAVAPAGFSASGRPDHTQVRFAGLSSAMIRYMGGERGGVPPSPTPVSMAPLSVVSSVFNSTINPSVSQLIVVSIQCGSVQPKTFWQAIYVEARWS